MVMPPVLVAVEPILIVPVVDTSLSSALERLKPALASPIPIVVPAANVRKVTSAAPLLMVPGRLTSPAVICTAPSAPAVPPAVPPVEVRLPLIVTGPDADRVIVPAAPPLFGAEPAVEFPPRVS